MNELLEEEIMTIINNSAWNTSQKLLSTFFSDSFHDEDIVKDLSTALKQILSFIEKGGKIEFTPFKSDREVTDTNKLLIESFTISRELECLKELSEKAQLKEDELGERIDILSAEIVV